MKLLDKLFGRGLNKELKRIRGIVDEINAKENDIKKLKDDDFPKRTEELKKQVAEVVKYKDDQDRILLTDEQKEKEKKISFHSIFVFLPQNI